VDASTDDGVVTHRATGFLNSIDPAAPVLAAASSLNPLKPQLYRSSKPYGMFSIYDGIVAAGARAQIIAADEMGYQDPWPGDGGDYGAWEAAVSTLATRVKNEHRTFEWDMWNEPNDGSLFWKRSRDQFFETWRRGVVALRAVLPDAVVVGPSVSNF